MAYQLRDSDPDRSLLFTGAFCRYGHAHVNTIKARACDGLGRAGWIYRRPTEEERGTADAEEALLVDPTLSREATRRALRLRREVRRRREAAGSEDRASPLASRSTGLRAVLDSAASWVSRRVRRP